MNPRRRPLRRMQQQVTAYSVVPDWFQHIGQETSPNSPAYENDEDDNELVLPPIFAYRSQQNYKTEHLFSEFDNRWNNDQGFGHHEKTLRIAPEISHRVVYESPELMTWNQGVKPVYSTTTNSAHRTFNVDAFLKRRFPTEYTGVKTGIPLRT